MPQARREDRPAAPSRRPRREWQCRAEHRESASRTAARKRAAPLRSARSTQPVARHRNRLPQMATPHPLRATARAAEHAAVKEPVRRRGHQPSVFSQPLPGSQKFSRGGAGSRRETWFSPRLRVKNGGAEFATSTVNMSAIVVLVIAALAVILALGLAYL